VGSLKALSVDDQLGLWSDAVLDPRGAVRLGWPAVDAALRRGGLSPSNLVILGGRTRTRKTTVTVNLIANMLLAGHAVGLVGLDEAPWQYAAKVASAMTGYSHVWLEQNWGSPEAQEARTAYLERGRHLTLSQGYRPHTEALSAFLDMAEVTANRPEVVFLDYTGLMSRGRFAGKDVERIPKLVEDLQVWTNEQQVVTVILHQVGRLEARYDGDTPMDLTYLKYGGEEMADIVFATYRPALDRVGNMTEPEAKAYMGDQWDEDLFFAHRNRVKNYQASTFFQVLKNRPGLDPPPELLHGIELVSQGESMRMVPSEKDVDDAMRLEVPGVDGPSAPANAPPTDSPPR
jgi:replicative DNA helicase